MAKLVDLTGQRFGMLQVIKQAESKGKNSAWVCRCDCGKITTVTAPNLKSGGTISCGCFRDNSTIARSTKHRGSRTRLYKVWSSMKARCNNPKNKEYDRYGGRGISVCDEWVSDFGAFQDWAVSNGYKEGLSIDRIDNNKGYSPDNCRWATVTEQNNNRAPRRWAKRPAADSRAVIA